MRPTRALAVLAALSLALLAACASEGDLRVDGLPIDNAQEFIDEVDSQWAAALEAADSRWNIDDSSRCYFLVYDNVALNSIVCGPIFWLGDQSPTWDYYPLMTRLSEDGSSFHAVAEGDFHRDYPMSDADDLRRPDELQPVPGVALSEPAAPVTDEEILYPDSLPDAWRIQRDITYPEPVTLVAGPLDSTGTPATCLRLSRAIWSTHLGTGPEVVAPPSGQTFLTLVPADDPCPPLQFPIVAGGPEVPAEDDAPEITIDGTTIEGGDWTRMAAYLSPAGTIHTAEVTATLAGTEVSADLLTGAVDPVTEAFADQDTAAGVSGSERPGTVVEDPWSLSSAVAPRPLTADEGAPAAGLYGWLPQFGQAPDGQRWIIVGLTATASLTESVSGTVAQGGTMTVGAALQLDDEEVEADVYVDEAQSNGPLTRAITIVGLVPDDTTAATVQLALTLDGWTSTLAPVHDLGRIEQELTARVTF